jgi:hypothetical protein
MTDVCYSTATHHGFIVQTIYGWRLAAVRPDTMAESRQDHIPSAAPRGG